MLKFSLGVPKKIHRRVENMPETKDLMELCTMAMTKGDHGKDFGIAWTYQEVEFRLFVRYEKPVILWRMWNSLAPDSQAPWSTAERNVRAVHMEVVECCNEITGVKGSRGVPPSPPPTPHPDTPAVAPNDDKDFLAGVGTGLTDVEARWLKSLARQETPAHALSLEDPAAIALAQTMTKTLMSACAQVVKRYAHQYNESLFDSSLRVMVTDVGEVTDWLPKRGFSSHEQERVIRWRASTKSWSIYARARLGEIELFIIPAAEAVSLGAENELQPVCRMSLLNHGTTLRWSSDGLPISAHEVRRLLQLVFTGLVNKTVHDEKEPSANLLHPLDVAQLEKRNLAQKVVTQQEEMQRRIARDLHDAVIADVTLLKRAIVGDRPLTANEAAEALDQVIARLRDICYELAPSDLKDWGLQTTLEALLESVAQRTDAECTMQCKVEIPSLESSVELHIFRILQETVNNSAKYSGASEITLKVTFRSGRLTFVVEDNGKGFDPTEAGARTKDGGMGWTSMQERIELIRGIYPARLEVQSQPGTGTTTTLSLQVRLPD
jgi:signal transduction histidine kinase